MVLIFGISVSDGGWRNVEVGAWVGIDISPMLLYLQKQGPCALLSHRSGLVPCNPGLRFTDVESSLWLSPVSLPAHAHFLACVPVSSAACFFFKQPVCALCLDHLVLQSLDGSPSTDPFLQNYTQRGHWAKKMSHINDILSWRHTWDYLFNILPR